MIHNPIFPGFNPDPCICKQGGDYYVAVSTFEWFPGIPVYHSKDLKNWELYSHVLTDDDEVDLKKLPSAKGIWAPCLSLMILTKKNWGIIIMHPELCRSVSRMSKQGRGMSESEGRNQGLP